MVGLLLQTNPNNRISCDQILNHEIVQRKISEIKNKDFISENQAACGLLGTIKMPRNISEINQKLPKKKMYNQEK